MSEPLNGDTVDIAELAENQPRQWLHPAYPVGVIVVKHNDNVTVWHNLCPHQARPLNYATGKYLQTPEGQLVCAAHGATFELTTGECIAGPCKGSMLRQVSINQYNGQVRLANDISG